MTLRKRPRDPAELAKLMIDIASGEVEDRSSTKKKKTAKQRPQRWKSPRIKSR